VTGLPFERDANIAAVAAAPEAAETPAMIANLVFDMAKTRREGRGGKEEEAKEEEEEEEQVNSQPGFKPL